MRNALLIAGREERYYYEKFVEPCRARSVNVYVLDPGRFPTDAVYSAALDSSGGLTAYLTVDRFDGVNFQPERLKASDIDVAWHLRESVSPPEADQSVGARFARNEAYCALHSLLSILECPWINKRETIHFISSNKLYQQHVARQCGLSVPHTLIGNDPEPIAAFARQNEQVLLKAIGYIKLDERGEFHLYSELYTHEEIAAGVAAIRSCPVFCQEYVPKRYEHRAMVIGERVLNCRIDSQASELTKVDWRHYDFERVEHKQVDLPLAVQERLRAFMRRLGLRYGAIDLIERPDGEFVFLEVNPSGQWGWIADFAGLQIPEAVAAMLAVSERPA